MLPAPAVDRSTLDLIADLQSKQYMKGTIRDIQIDCISHRYPLLGKPVSEQGLVILSNKDIIAMKLNAISASKQRVKDFIDIYFLLKNFAWMRC